MLLLTFVPTRNPEWTFDKTWKVGDIGMIPSENLRETFVEFAKENKLFDRSSEISKLNEKIAYTLATYEIRTENGTPKNKKDLQGLSVLKLEFFLTLNWILVDSIFVIFDMIRKSIHQSMQNVSVQL